MKKVRNVVLFLLLLLSFCGCENRFENDQLPPGSDELTVEQARLFLEKQRSDQISLKSGSLNSIGLKADWKNASLNSNEKVNVVETDILTLGGKFGFAMKESFVDYEKFLQVGYLYSPTRLVIKKNRKTNEMVCFLMTIVGDKGYLEEKCFDLWNNNYLRMEDNFTGLVLFHNLDGQFVKGWRYSSGKICGRLNAVQNTDTGLRLKSTGGWNCEQETIYFMTFEDRYQTVYTNGVNPIESYSYTSVHTTEIVVSDCTYDPRTGSGGGSGESPASDPYEYVPSVPLPAIDIRAKFKNDEKIMCVFSNLIRTASTSFNPLVTSFLANFSDYITIDPGDITFDLDTLNGAYGQCAPYGDKFEIILNENEISNRSAVELAKTLIHEILHAQLGHSMQTSWGPFRSMFSSYISSKSGRIYIDQHQLMMENYVGPIVRFLMDFDSQNGYNAPYEYYEALALSGLDINLTSVELKKILEAQNYFRTRGLYCH